MMKMKVLWCLLAAPVTSFVSTPKGQQYRYHERIAQSAATSLSSPLASPLNDVVEFPPPLNAADRIKRAATFWSSTIPIAADYYAIIGKIKLRELMGSELSDDEIEMLWDNQHKDGAQKLASAISNLKGFYVKAAQIISTRQDLFPKHYINALNVFTDNMDPMPASLAKAVVSQELLNQDENFEDVFTEFDETPLGAASIAQVHRAVLSKKYGGPREVAVKIQRPSIESKLMGDIANLMAISKTFQRINALPLDFYTIFSELEKQLAGEFDFVGEAVAMDRVYNSLAQTLDGTPRSVPMVIPRPVAGLVSRRVLVMDFLRGFPLSRAREEMQKKGIDPDSPEAKLFGRKLLTALTTVFGRNILETGYFHADPHPGNIFVLEDGNIGLIDFGQVKQISDRNRETLAKIMVALEEREGDDRPEDLEKIGNLTKALGFEFYETAQKEAAAAVAMWLFDGTVKNMPGGYDKGELSPNAPVKELKTFPQDLVLVGRSTVLIKALSNRFGVPWSLAKEWAPLARLILHGDIEPSMEGDKRKRFRHAFSALKQWGAGKANHVMRRLPSPLRSRLASLVVKIQQRKGVRE